MELRIILQDGTQRTLRPAGGRLTIGRSRANDVVIADGELSRNHAEIELLESGSSSTRSRAVSTMAGRSSRTKSCVPATA